MSVINLESFARDVTIEFVRGKEKVTYKISFFVNKINNEIRGVIRNKEGELDKILYGAINGNRCKFIATEIIILSERGEISEAEFFKLNLFNKTGSWGIVDPEIQDKGPVSVTSYKQSRSDLPEGWLEVDFYNLIKRATPKGFEKDHTSLKEVLKNLNYI